MLPTFYPNKDLNPDLSMIRTSFQGLTHLPSLSSIICSQTFIPWPSPLELTSLGPPRLCLIIPGGAEHASLLLADKLSYRMYKFEHLKDQESQSQARHLSCWREPACGLDWGPELSMGFPARAYKPPGIYINFCVNMPISRKSKAFRSKWSVTI